MPPTDRSLALAVLRTIRGWTQRDLARAAEVRTNSVSEFERGTAAPDAETMRRMVTAMGYPPAAVEWTRRFVVAVREGQRPPRGGGAGFARGAQSEPDGLTPLGQEVEQLAAEMDAALARLGRVLRELARREEEAGGGSGAGR